MIGTMSPFKNAVRLFQESATINLGHIMIDAGHFIYSLQTNLPIMQNGSSSFTHKCKHTHTQTHVHTPTYIRPAHIWLWNSIMGRIVSLDRAMDFNWLSRDVWASFKIA